MFAGFNRVAILAQELDLGRVAIDDVQQGLDRHPFTVMGHGLGGHSLERLGRSQPFRDGNRDGVYSAYPWFQGA